MNTPNYLGKLVLAASVAASGCADKVPTNFNRERMGVASQVDALLIGSGYNVSTTIVAKEGPDELHHVVYGPKGKMVGNLVIRPDIDGSGPRIIVSAGIGVHRDDYSEEFRTPEAAADALRQTFEQKAAAFNKQHTSGTTFAEEQAKAEQAKQKAAAASDKSMTEKAQ